jgi:hypothetical protein
MKGAQLQNVSLDPAQRAGILTRASFLTVHAASNGSNPVKRGKAIFFRMLCGTMPDPPAGVPTVKPPADNLTTRQRFAEHSTSPMCAACHSILDPLGFAFEAYDGIGRFRTMEGKLPVETKGLVSLPKGGQKSYADARELSAILAASDDVRECMARQWMRYALRREEGTADENSLFNAMGAYARSGYNARDLTVALATTRSFLFRQPGAQEVTQ